MTFALHMVQPQATLFYSSVNEKFRYFLKQFLVAVRLEFACDSISNFHVNTPRPEPYLAIFCRTKGEDFQKFSLGSETLGMTYEGFEDIFEVDFADM